MTLKSTIIYIGKFSSTSIKLMYNNTNPVRTRMKNIWELLKITHEHVEKCRFQSPIEVFANVNRKIANAHESLVDLSLFAANWKFQLWGEGVDIQKHSVFKHYRNQSIAIRTNFTHKKIFNDDIWQNGCFHWIRLQGIIDTVDFTC